MKKLSIILLCLIMGLSSCNDFLDVNENPNTPNESVPTPDLRLPPIITQMMDAYGSGATRCAYITQSLGFYNSVGSRYYEIQCWNLRSSDMNWPWQAWYVNSAVNIAPMIEKAQAENAYHYEAAGRFLYAYGFSSMAAMYGSVVFDDFATETILPSYQKADYVYEKCLKEIDMAIDLFKKEQPAGATPFQKGDILAGGNTNIWIKACYGLKARLMNHLSGSSSFNAEEVLQALNNAAQSNSDNLFIKYVNDPADATSNLESLQYTNVSTTARVGVMMYKYLYNAFPGGSSVIDPRRDTLIPMNVFANSTTNPELAARVLPVDITSDFLPNAKGVSSKPEYKVDSLYAAYGKGRSGNKEYGCLRGLTFYTNRESVAYLMPYHEIELIRAEVLFNKGDKPGAYTAYLNGMRANMQELGLDNAKIDAHIASAAVPQNSGALTLSHIMREKFISCLYTMEPWYDMRKYNYSTEVYPGYNKPNEKFIWTQYPSNGTPQRFPVATYETDYNSAQIRLAEPDYDKPSYTTKIIFPLMGQ